jgi:hypothetical protein
LRAMLSQRVGPGTGSLCRMLLLSTSKYKSLMFIVKGCIVGAVFEVEGKIHVVTLRRRFWRLIVPLLLNCLAVPLAAAKEDFWSKKPYQNWSAEETRRLLEDSPWATTYTLTGIQPDITSGGGVPGGEMEANPSITYTLQFRSARPIREAQVRSSQLSSHYDAMSVEQKSAFEANARKFLAVTFPDRIVVSVSFHSTVGNLDSLLRNYWSRQSLATLSMSVYLNADKEKLSLMNYSVKEDTFQLTFPRTKQLRPDGNVSVEFVHPRINVIEQQRIFQKFSLKKMLVNGEPVL